jgi:hypothetical protein
LKRRLKQEQKAKEKAEKEKTEQDSKSTKKNDTTPVIKEDDVSPNVSQAPQCYSIWHSSLNMVIHFGNM